ncbi:putative galactan -beta-galactosidase protein [Eutypa lata UCREL1]|uniref:Putative galactan-beta-galactosidase protein n=1 Tax=Eutypa lata (strain UCR-EL1) TaxID=1287681 RepID=M7T9R5_EUTLA|nr:putative galactan -beta-galactosidase protein [Eutypa lata UCREL1]
MLRSLLLAAGAATSALAADWISPGAVWYDTDGKKIEAHGGGVVLRGDTYYWVGHASSNQTPMMYSSTDLVNWKNLGQQASSVSGMWRPKIAKPNGSYWLYGQQDRYVLSLKSSEFTSGYGQSAKVHLPPSDYSYSDTGMFYDEDDRFGGYEAPGIVKADGVYFLIASGKTGWRSNPNKVFWADSIQGPWDGGSDIAPQAENTYNSQNTYELTVKGSEQTTYIYMGDSWDSKGGADSNYVWLPMDIDTGSHSITLQYHESWKVDVKTGAVSYPSTLKRYEAEDAGLSGKAVSSDSEVTFHNVTGTGSLQWFAFHYKVNDPEAGEAYIYVNDEPAVNISSLNHRAGYHPVVPVQLKLQPGDVNTITVGSVGTEDFQMSVDCIELYKEDDL